MRNRAGTDVSGYTTAEYIFYGGERSYTNTCPQNYKFEGKERDTETGNDDFGARYYSNRFGRWLSADWSSVPVPVPYANLTNPQTLNLYAMVADDPESFADLDGHTQTLTYQVANPAASSAWDPSAAESMSDMSGLTLEEFNALQAAAAAQAAQQAQNPQTPQSLAAQVPPEAKAAIAASVKASNSPTADDKQGGFHEEGGQWAPTSSGNTVVVPAKPGPANPAVIGGAHMDPTNAVNPSLKDNITGLGGTWHVHPSGTIVVEEGNRRTTSSFNQPPSGKDIKEAGAGINIVVGAGNKRVYFYNSTGVIGKPMKLKDFLK